MLVDAMTYQPENPGFAPRIAELDGRIAHASAIGADGGAHPT